MNTQGKEGSYTPIIIVLLISLAIAGLWDTFPIIKDSIHKILNPSAGVLLNWDINYGFILLISIITFITTLAQKYLTDQKTIKEMRDEQKKLNEEMKGYKDNPQKIMELQKKQFEFMGPMMKLSMRPMIFTGVPLILFFRWFMDVFTNLGNPKFFGFLSWFWFYLIVSIIISSILRKVFKVV